MDRKMIYVMSRSDGMVKVGISGSIKNRIQNIKQQTGLNISLEFKSEYLDNSLDVEMIAHKSLSDFNVAGEWFDCDVDSAINSCKKAVTDFGVISKHQFADTENHYKGDVCKYRNCGKKLVESSGAGRKKHFCDNKCKRMEQYYKSKDKI